MIDVKLIYFILFIGILLFFIICKCIYDKNKINPEGNLSPLSPLSTKSPPSSPMVNYTTIPKE